MLYETPVVHAGCGVFDVLMYMRVQSRPRSGCCVGVVTLPLPATRHKQCSRVAALDSCDMCNDWKGVSVEVLFVG